MNPLKIDTYHRDYYCNQCGKHYYTRNMVAMHEGFIIVDCPYCEEVEENNINRKEI